MNIENEIKYLRYLWGFIIGILFEYLVRVKFEIYPLVIIVLLTIAIIIKEESKSKNKC